MVEVDEKKLRKRKYHRDTVLKMFNSSRGWDPAKKRCLNSSIITRFCHINRHLQKFYSPGSIFYTDGWPRCVQVVKILISNI